MLDFLNQTISSAWLLEWGEAIGDWVFLAAFGLLGVELVRYALKRRLTWNLIGDAAANYITLALFFVTLFLIGALYVGGLYLVYDNLALFEIPTTPWSVALAIVLADLAYYWEHRFSHRVGIAWMTHTVHHSSPHYNLSVANRFGPLDGVFPFIFHAPLVLIGFNPLLVLFAEGINLTYQTWLHTEAIKKLPKPIEAVFNTPSHHRVHHGRNPQYMDKNYGGILIVWDKLFGTFAEEQEKVDYGVTEPLNSINPLVVWFHGFGRLAKKMRGAPDWQSKLACLWRPPDWEAGR